MLLHLGNTRWKATQEWWSWKDEAQYDVDQEEYDYSVGSILEQLKQKVVELFGTMQQKINEIVENVQEKVGKTKESFGSIVDEIK